MGRALVNASGIDGKLINYAVEYSNRRINPSLQEDFMSSADGDEFYNTEGEQSKISSGNVEDFFDAEGNNYERDFDEFLPDSYLNDDYDTDYSNFTIWSKKKRRKFGKNLKKFGQNVGKFAQNIAASSLASKQPSVTPVMPPPPPPPPPVKKGLSVGMQVGIAVGAVVLIGVAAYFISKKK
jgi:hypothetical protein